MPVFNPPLGRETTVPLSSSDHDRFVHLSFTLAFELGEDASGSWELWTDIPDVDDQGHLVTGPGEWRAVPFGLIPIESSVHAGDNLTPDASNKEGLVITVPPAPLTSAPLPIDHTLIAEMVVPANSASYFYTHRRVTESGETQWLGNGGDNGVVRVLECEATTKHVEQKEWKGVGIELQENGLPIIHHLPVDDSVKASIILLESVPAPVQPIYQLLESPKKSETHTPGCLVIVSNDLAPVSIQRNSTIPVAAGLQEHHDRHRSFSEILAGVCKNYKKVEVIKSTAKGIVAFIYRSEPDSPTSYLVLHSTSRREEQLATSFSDVRGDSKAALAIKEVHPDSHGARYIPLDPKQITLNPSSDATSSVVVFEIAQFVTLPGMDSSYLIAAGSALSQSVSKKAATAKSEGDSPTTENTVKQNQDVDAFLDNSDSTSNTLEEAARLAESPTPDNLEVPDLVADDGDSIESGSDSPISRPIKPVSFLSWLKRFFVGFWSWLFAPFGLKRLAGQAGDDKPDSGTVTPNERTHLLSTSAATSSTAVSPYSSPETGKVKAELAKVAYPEPPRVEAQHDLTVPAWDQTQVESKTEWEAKFTFTKTPFRFFFSPNQFRSIELGFEYKRAGSSQWTEAKVPQAAEVKKGYCDEVTIEVPGVEAEDDRTLWEARWFVL